jgi:hypothetical protein
MVLQPKEGSRTAREHIVRRIEHAQGALTGNERECKQIILRELARSRPARSSEAWNTGQSLCGCKHRDLESPFPVLQVDSEPPWRGLLHGSICLFQSNRLATFSSKNFYGIHETWDLLAGKAFENSVLRKIVLE